MPRRIQYRVIMVNPDGGAPTELTRAQVLEVTWELNAPGEATYRLPMLDPQSADAALLLQREVQIWRAGVLIWWGIPVAYRATVQSVEFTAYGLLYYFQRRHFGPVYSNATEPLLANGNMEANPVTTGWLSAPSTSTSAPPVVAASLITRYAGRQAMRLTGGGNPDLLYYVYQFYDTPSPVRSQPLTVTLSAWAYPDAVTVWPNSDRGIEIQDATPVPPHQQWTLMNAKVPQNQWSRHEVTLDVGANALGPLTIGLFAPTSGAIIYDQVRLTYQQQTGALAGEDWVDDFLRRVFNLGAGNTGGGSTGPGGSAGPQNAWWGARQLKSALGMTFFPSLIAAGTLHADTYFDHEDGGNVYEAMLEVVKRDKADFEITWDKAGKVRGLTPYVPRKGSVKRALALQLGRNITQFSFDVDGRMSANDVRVVGRNSGDTKEVGQGGGPIPSTLAGRQFETVKAAPVEVDGQGLIDYAVTEERRLNAPVKVPTIVAKAAGLLDTTNVGGPLTVGDIVPVQLDYGIIKENDLRRVVAMTLRPESETLALVLNVVV